MRKSFLKLDSTLRWYSCGAFCLLIYFILTKCGISTPCLYLRMLFSLVTMLVYAIVCCEEILQDHKGGIIGSACLAITGLIGFSETAYMLFIA